ncbi:MAG: hypothetical protein MUO58_22185 [Anaerolineales bacterium]|nr:hypothetical protein [Anaerolineales bacterium]
MAKRNCLAGSFILSLLLILTACGTGTKPVVTIEPAPAETTAIEPAPVEPTAVIPALLEPTNTPEMFIPDMGDAGNAPSGFSIPDAPLSKNGPWLVFIAGDGLWAANPDGSGLTHLLSARLDEWFYRDAVVSDYGGLVAFLNGTDRYFDLSLTVYNIPERRIVRTISLTTPETEPPRDVVMSVEATRAITYVASYAFSPDGSMLAFMGVMEGPSSDLYIYNLEEDTITRITDGPSQGFSPYWSPDGTYIVHFGAASFGTGAGYVMEGAWAARSDDSGVISLYDPSESGAEEFIGWADDHTFLVNSWNMHCGPINLRAIDINNRSEQVLWPDAFNDIVYDEVSGTLAVAVGIDYEDCNPQGRFGVFLVPLDGSPPRHMLAGEIRYFVHDDQNFHIVAHQDDSRQTQIFPDGQLVPLNSAPIDYDYPNPVISPDGLWVAWPRNFPGEVWIGRRDPTGTSPPELMLAETIWKAAWSPNSSTLFLFGTDSLYLAYAPDFVPALVAEIMPMTQVKIFWVTP